MSRAFGLVKFNSNNHVYCYIYNGTSDVCNPFLFNLDKLENGTLYELTGERLVTEKWSVEDLTTLEPVEIYSDYGGGFYWDGLASEKEMKIASPLMPFDDLDCIYTDGCPKWVNNILNEENDDGKNI